MSDTWSNFSLEGCLVGEGSQAAPALEVKAGGVPERVDLRQFCSPVENQGRTNSCVANAVVGALELHQVKAGMPLTDLSRLFLYYNARELFNLQHMDKGTRVQHAMAALLAHGCCEARLWPFQPTNVNTQPTQNCYANAAHHEAIQFARAPHGDAALSVLAEGVPIAFTMFAPVDYYVVAAQSGTMPRPDQIRAQPVPAGHAMLIVGYDLADRTYLVRNSFGTQFAENGYFKLPFETLDVWGDNREFWAIGAIEQAAAFKLTGPSMADVASGLGVSVTASVSKPEAGSVDKLRSDLRSRLSSDLETSKRDFRNRLRGK
ncbi:MAG: C1 family peptidase [Pseudomonadota bacterium]